MSLEFYCRLGSTVESIYIIKKYLKNWGSNVVGVLLGSLCSFFGVCLTLEFYGQHPFGSYSDSDITKKS